MRRIVLSEEEVRKEYREPNRAAVEAIVKAVAHQNWVKMHSEVSFKGETMGAPYQRLIQMMKEQLPTDKYQNALSLLRFPLPSNAVVDSVFNDLADIFSGRNPVFSYQFKDPKSLEDWEYYRTNILGEPNVWSSVAWRYFRSEINSIIVVDLPSEGNVDPEDRKPQPYFYFVPIDAVKSFRLTPDGKGFEWVMFLDSNGGVTVIDSESYRTFELTESGIGEQTSENKHFLTYCPSRFFWEEPLSVTNPAIKKSPLTKVLPKLDWYVFADINKRFNDIAGAYPIYWGFEEDCDYHDQEGHYCEHGHLCNADGKPAIDEQGHPMMCPECAKHRVTGPGSFVRVPVPSADQPNLGEPVGKLGVDRNSLEYNVEDLIRQKQDIVDSCIGKDSDIVQEASLTDKQVDATYEKRAAVLERIKEGFESIQKFVDETICLLRYGKSDFLHCSISYGTSFFTLSVETLRKQYTEAKASGASRSELMALSEQIIQTEYRNNPQVIERMRILLQVEPYVGLSVNDVLNICEKGGCDKATFELKANFETYLAKFERENGNITEFGLMQSGKDRVDTISKTLYDYARQTINGRRDSGLNSRNVSTSGDEGGE